MMTPGRVPDVHVHVSGRSMWIRMVRMDTLTHDVPRVEGL